MIFDNKIISFELTENNKCIKYKYFGELQWSSDGIGIEFNYPVEKTKTAWYVMLKDESDIMKSACFGSLYYDLKMLGDVSFKEIYGEVSDIIKSNKFKEFVDHWFTADGSIFSEPTFFDGMFGKFSSYGDVGYPDNEEESNDLIWIEQSITIKMNQNGTFDDLRGKLFIDEEFESKFEKELKSIVDLFED